MKNKLAAVTALSVLASGAVSAEQGSGSEAASPSNRYIGVLATYMQPDDARAPEVDYGNGVGVLFGSQWQSGLGWELNLFADLIETGKNQGTDYYRQNIGADLFYAFGNRERFTPFALIGAGYARNDVFPDERDDSGWLANAGIGFVTSPIVFDLFRLRGELRYIYDDFEEGLTDYRAGLGLEFPIYRRVVTITQTKTEEKVRVVEVYSGLSDADGDGVVDRRDRCPDTPHGVRVDGDGCTLQKVTTLRGVTFELDSAELRPDSRTILSGVSDILKKYPDMQVEIAGHTDTTGSDSHNQSLSQRRAESVRSFLMESGVPPQQMTAVGYGETQPVHSNENREGREQNRRVEMRIKN